MNPYESTKLVDEYLLFHFGEPEDVLPWPQGPPDALDFAVRTVDQTFPWDSIPTPGRALDLGCAVGRSSFELSTRCESVVGIDYSAAFIRAAETIRTEGELAYRRLEEAGQFTSAMARRPAAARPERVEFETGDAMNLRDDLGAFHLVHAANLVCRLTEPARFLDRLPSLLESGGYLVLTTPCTWLEEFTPRDNWPKTTTLDLLHEHLDAAFDLCSTMDMPFVIREHRRKFQWTVAQSTVWQRH